MRLWPWLAVAAFALMGWLLKAWRSRAATLLWLRCWAIWFGVSVFGAAISSRILQSLELGGTTWQQAWATPLWQLKLWFLASLPVALALPLDLNAEQGDFRRSRYALAAGLAFAPVLLGAFEIAQLVDFLAPFSFLALAARVMPRAMPVRIMPLWTLALLNGLGFVHGLFNLPAWVGSLLLAACLCFGLNPYGRAAALAAMALAALGIALKIWLQLPAMISMVMVCLLITGGWLLNTPHAENDLAQTA